MTVEGSKVTQVSSEKTLILKYINIKALEDKRLMECYKQFCRMNI